MMLSDGLIEDGVLAQDETELRNLWEWRDRIPEAIGKAGPCYKYDISIPLNKLYDIVGDLRSRLSSAGVMGDSDDKPAISTLGYGHIGDGNLHLNVTMRRFDKEVEALLEPYVYEWIEKVNGSISAEHGLGFAKKNFIQYSKDPIMVKMMKSIKARYDPVSYNFVSSVAFLVLTII